jgi:hypothetical protein
MYSNGRTLVPDDVLDIYNRCLDGEPQSSIADDYDISQQSVSAIATGRNWGTLTGQQFMTGGRSTLHPEAVLLIDADLVAGLHPAEIALKHEVSIHTVRMIKSGRNWSAVTGRTPNRR